MSFDFHFQENDLNLNYGLEIFLWSDKRESGGIYEFLINFSRKKKMREILVCEA